MVPRPGRAVDPATQDERRGTATQLAEPETRVPTQPTPDSDSYLLVCVETGLEGAWNGLVQQWLLKETTQRTGALAASGLADVEVLTAAYTVPGRLIKTPTRRSATPRPRYDLVIAIRMRALLSAPQMRCHPAIDGLVRWLRAVAGPTTVTMARDASGPDDTARPGAVLLVNHCSRDEPKSLKATWRCARSWHLARDVIRRGDLRDYLQTNLTDRGEDAWLVLYHLAWASDRRRPR